MRRLPMYPLPLGEGGLPQADRVRAALNQPTVHTAQPAMDFVASVAI